MFGAQFGRRQQRRALVQLQLVGYGEFFQQPGDTLALSDLEMVHGKFWRGHGVVGGRVLAYKDVGEFPQGVLFCCSL